MRQKFVGGGSDETRLVPTGGDMRKERVSLSDRQKMALYEQHLLGEKVEDLAAAYGISRSAAYSHIAAMRNRQESKHQEDEMAFSPKVIAGDKRNGRLMFTSAAGSKYEGTHLTSDGEMHRMKFTAKNGHEAKTRWAKWCDDLDAKAEWMNMVERNVEAVKEQDDEPKAVCGAPLDPIEEIRSVEQVDLPTDEEIHQAQDEFDAQTEKVFEATGVPLADTSEPAYLIWAKRPEPRCYGLYLTMEAALSEVDKLNEVAKFLGGDGTFEVEEVAWKL